jgi:hypothetical protein
MDHNTGTLTTTERYPTQHAMLVIWGHYAQTIGLVEALAKVKIAQKAVVRMPYEKIAELLVGLLAGIEYLTDLSEGAAPLSKDSEVATAWKLSAMADASGVSRTLSACDDEAGLALETMLNSVAQPFLLRAVSDLRQRNQPLVLDADLTGRPVSSTSRTYPGAAFGYMDGEIRLGYQLAEICLETHLYGRQWLSAQHHPGDTVSAPCLLGLLQAAEQRMGCHPRRRTELVQQRIQACEQAIVALEQQTVQQSERLSVVRERIERLAKQICQAEAGVQTLLNSPSSTRQAGPYSRLNRLQRQLAGWQAQYDRAQKQLVKVRTVVEGHKLRLQDKIQSQRTEWKRLHARYAQLCQDNTQECTPPRCKIRLDAGFANGENLTALIELGYDVDTKSANPALVQALCQQVTAAMSWRAVGKNAAMVGWTNYYIYTCPYPLTVGLERFYTPKGMLHAVLIRFQDGPQPTCPDLVQWFHDYNGRQTIEAGNKEEKTTFKVQHLMSRSPAGICIQAMLTVFAANFVRWADEWVRPRVELSTARFTNVLDSPKRLVRIAANSPATLERIDGREQVRFGHLSSFDGVVIRLSGSICRQLSLPLFANDYFSSA